MFTVSTIKSEKDSCLNKPKRSNKYPAPEVTRANAKIKGSDLPLEAKAELWNMKGWES